MKDNATKIINNNINILNNISIVDNHNELWELNQLKEKCKILLTFLDQEVDIDMQKFYDILQITQSQVDYFSEKFAL